MLLIDWWHWNEATLSYSHSICLPQSDSCWHRQSRGRANPIPENVIMVAVLGTTGSSRNEDLFGEKRLHHLTFVSTNSTEVNVWCDVYPCHTHSLVEVCVASLVHSKAWTIWHIIGLRSENCFCGFMVCAAPGISYCNGLVQRNCEGIGQGRIQHSPSAR